MKESESNGCQILSDGRRVWVNASSGESLARLSVFGTKALIDVHQPLALQRTNGIEGLDCRHDLTGAGAWLHFVEALKTHYQVEIEEEHRPDWAK